MKIQITVFVLLVLFLSMCSVNALTITIITDTQSELSENKILTIRRSLCDVGVVMCVLGILGTSSYLVRYYKEKREQ